MTRLLAPMVAVWVAVALVGCSSDDESTATEPGTTTEPVPTERAWTEEEVLELSGIRSREGGMWYSLPGHPDCTAAVVMTTRGTVDLYAGAGDVVATNPDGTVGVDTTPECVDPFEDALAAVK